MGRRVLLASPHLIETIVCLCVLFVCVAAGAPGVVQLPGQRRACHAAMGTGLAVLCCVRAGGLVVVRGFQGASGCGFGCRVRNLLVYCVGDGTCRLRDLALYPQGFRRHRPSPTPPHPTPNCPSHWSCQPTTENPTPEWGPQLHPPQLATPPPHELQICGPGLRQGRVSGFAAEISSICACGSGSADLRGRCLILTPACGTACVVAHVLQQQGSQQHRPPQSAAPHQASGTAPQLLRSLPLAVDPHLPSVMNPGFVAKYHD